MLYFLFQAGVIPLILLMTDPTSTDAPSWLQDIEATKNLLMHPSLSTNRLAARCLQVVNRLCSPAYTSTAADRTAGQPPILMQFPDQLFNDPTFGTMFPDVDQELNLGGMDFSEWVNYTPQAEFS
jgi:transcriptional regulatory protein GAL4